MVMVTPTESVTDVDEAFLALVCDDDELLRAEFDAIVGAAWPPSGTHSRPADPGGAAGDQVRVEDLRRTATLRAVRREGGPVDRRRERAPPPCLEGRARPVAGSPGGSRHPVGLRHVVGEDADPSTRRALGRSPPPACPPPACPPTSCAPR